MRIAEYHSAALAWRQYLDSTVRVSNRSSEYRKAAAASYALQQDVTEKEFLAYQDRFIPRTSRRLRRG